MDNILKSNNLKMFLNSFDTIFYDIDGPKFLGETAMFLTKLGLNRQIVCVTNYNFIECKRLHESFCTFSHIVKPVHAIIRYLKNIEFDKDLLYIGHPKVREEFINAKIKLKPILEHNELGSTADLLNLVMEDFNVGAVLFDHNYNVSYTTLSKASYYLQEKGVLFLTVPSQKYIVSDGKKHLGLMGLQNILEEISNSSIISFGKTSKNFQLYLMEKYNISDESKVLYIDNSLDQTFENKIPNTFIQLLVSPNSDELKQLGEGISGSVPWVYYTSMEEFNNLVQQELTSQTNLMEHNLVS